MAAGGGREPYACWCWHRRWCSPRHRGDAILCRPCGANGRRRLLRLHGLVQVRIALHLSLSEGGLSAVEHKIPRRTAPFQIYGWEQ